MSRSCRRCFLVTVEKVAREKRAKERGREEEEEEMDSREKQVRYEIAQEVVAGIMEKAGVYEDATSTAQRTLGQSVKQKIEEEEEEVWQQENKMEMQ